MSEDIYFISRETGLRVLPRSLGGLVSRSNIKSFITKTERGSRRKPFLVKSLNLAEQRAGFCGQSVCCKIVTKVAPHSVYRVEPNGDSQFLYHSGGPRRGKESA